MLLEANFASGSRRKLGGVEIERNNSLQFTNYTVIPGNTGLTPVEIYISDELRMAGLSFRELRDIVRVELQRVIADPFGATSIDPHVDDSELRARRSVNRLAAEAQVLIGHPLAVKSVYEQQEDNADDGISSSGREDLIAQYLFMRQLQLVAQRRLDERRRAKIEFLPVYGAVRVGEQQFLVMKYIKGAREIRDRVVPYRTQGGWPGNGEPISEMAFSGLEHPGFVQALGFSYPPEIVRWRDVGDLFEEMLGIHLHDLVGRNVLYYQHEGEMRYVVIDQKPKKS